MFAIASAWRGRPRMISAALGGLLAAVLATSDVALSQIAPRTEVISPVVPPLIIVSGSRNTFWQKHLGLLDGTYQGAVEVVAATPTTPAGFWRVGDRPELSLSIQGELATLRVDADGWRELRVGDGFRMLKVEGSGFVYAVQSAGGWVENWTLSVTKKSPDTLLVFLSFVAGGTLERIDALDAEFAVGAMGELQRVADTSAEGSAP